MQNITKLNSFWGFLVGDDLDFYEQFLTDLTDEEMNKFFQDNPGFMKEYHMYEGRRGLLRDEMYRGILRGIYKNKNISEVV